MHHYFNLYKILILLLFPEVPAGSSFLLLLSAPLPVVTYTHQTADCLPHIPSCVSIDFPPLSCRHSFPLESLTAASLHLILLDVVQVDIRGGHATHAQFLYEQRKLFKKSVEEVRSGAGRQVDAEVVNGCAGQGHTNSHQSVDGVAEERNHDQKNGAKAVDDGEEQGQLYGPMELRSFEAKVDLTGYRQADE